MATNIALVVTPWCQHDGTNHPKLTEHHALLAWEDVTGQDAASLTPAPNAYTVRARVDDAVLAALEADNRYLVLHSEPEEAHAPPD